MAISFVAYDEAHTNSGTSITLDVPAGAAADDLLIAIIHTPGAKVTASSNPFSWGAGSWIPAAYYNLGDDLYVFYRVMQSGDTNWAFTTTASTRIQGSILAYTESGTPTWTVSMADYPNEQPTVETPVGRVDVESGAALAIAYFDRGTASSMTAVSQDVGTARVNVVSASGTQALSVYDHIGTAHTAFTATATGTTAEAATSSVSFYTLPTASFYDTADLIDCVRDGSAHIYKGRDTAAADTTGAA